MNVEFFEHLARLLESVESGSTSRWTREGEIREKWAYLVARRARIEAQTEAQT